MMATHDTVAVMPGPRVTDRGTVPGREPEDDPGDRGTVPGLEPEDDPGDRGTVPGREPEDDPGDHGSIRATASRGNMDCRVKPGNDSTPLDAGLWLAGQER
jgi:hypothetical protein